MKNIFKILMATLIFAGFAACEPNEDIYDELPDNDSTYLANIDKISPVAEYTLTEEDYELSSNESVANYHNFSSYDPAEDYLPEIINQLFLAEAGEEMIVTYNFYKPIGIEDTLDTYELDSTDYTSSYYNIDNYTTIANFINDNYTAERGDIINLTYAWYFGGGRTDTVTNNFVNLGEEDWSVCYTLSAEDYDAMGLNYTSFDDEDEAKHKIPIFLETLNTDLFNMQYAQTGTEIYIIYNIYEDTDVPYLMHLELKSSGWEIIGDVIQETASLTSNGVSWSFVPPIDFVETSEPHTREYTLTESDYELVGNGNYHNFDVRPGANEESVEVRIEKISTILKANFSDLAIDDVFLVHYDVYTGSAEVWDITLKAVPAE